MPEPAACGRPATWTTREILNAIFYVLRGGIAWRLIPKDLPPKSTAFGDFSRWRDEGLFGRINHHLVMADRERVGREASPTAVVLDSQSVKTTESGGPRGYDAGKKVKGRKRQVMVDTDGRGLILEPQPADVQDRVARLSFCACRGARSRSSRRRSPIWASLETDRRRQPASPSRLSGSPPIRSASRSILGGGSSSASSLGSVGTGGSGRTRRQ